MGWWPWSCGPGGGRCTGPERCPPPPVAGRPRAPQVVEPERRRWWPRWWGGSPWPAPGPPAATGVPAGRGGRPPACARRRRPGPAWPRASRWCAGERRGAGPTSRGPPPPGQPRQRPRGAGATRAPSPSPTPSCAARRRTRGPQPGAVSAAGWSPFIGRAGGAGAPARPGGPRCGRAAPGAAAGGAGSRAPGHPLRASMAARRPTVMTVPSSGGPRASASRRAPAGDGREPAPRGLADGTGGAQGRAARCGRLWEEVQDLTATLHRRLRTRPGAAAPE